MTRQEFIDDVTTWSELRDFCDDNGCDYCDNVYSEESRDEYIDEVLRDMVDNAGSWRDLLDQLQDIPTGYDYYIRDDYDDWNGTDDGDDTFEDYKQDVLGWMDGNEYWEEDEEETYTEESFDEDDEEDDPIEDEDISIGELFNAAGGQLQSIEDIRRHNEEEAEEEFTEFVMGVVAVVEGN